MAKTMVRYMARGQRVTIEAVNELNTALGLPPLDTTRSYRPQEFWDPIAHHCGLPDTATLMTPIDGPPVEVLPAAIWNRAADIANRRSTQRET